MVWIRCTPQAHAQSADSPWLSGRRIFRRGSLVGRRKSPEMRLSRLQFLVLAWLSTSFPPWCEESLPLFPLWWTPLASPLRQEGRELWDNTSSGRKELRSRGGSMKDAESTCKFTGHKRLQKSRPAEKKERHFYARLSEAWIAVKKAEESLKQWWHTGEQLERWVCSDPSLYSCVIRGKVLIEFL